MDYVEKHSLLTDKFGIKFLLDKALAYPTLEYQGDLPILKLPEPKIGEESIELLEYTFPKNDDGKIRTSRLFRARVTHVTAHTLTEIPRLLKTRSLAAEFVETLVRDVIATAKIEAERPARIADLAYANALATNSFKPLKRIYLSSTRIMTAILAHLFGGRPLDGLAETESDIVAGIIGRLREIKSTVSTNINGGEIDLDRLREAAEWIHERLMKEGPFVEIPTFP